MGTLNFTKAAEPMQDFTEDPFYPTNNIWRKKPVAPEKDSAIRDRLSNYIKHIAYLLKAAVERQQDVVSFEHSMGLAKIYSGGIGILDQTEVPASWVNTYYNSNDALKAYQMFKNYLQKARYRGGSTGNWMEDDFNILLSIYGDLKEGK